MFKHYGTVASKYVFSIHGLFFVEKYRIILITLRLISPVCYTFSFSSPNLVSTVSLPNMEDNFEGGEALCVSYERGGKRKTLQYSREKNILMDKDDNIFVDFSEDFKTDATLYRETKTGKIQVLIN